MKPIVLSNHAINLMNVTSIYPRTFFNSDQERYWYIASLILSDLSVQHQGTSVADDLNTICNSINKLIISSRRDYQKEIQYTELSSYNFNALSLPQYIKESLASLGYSTTVIAPKFNLNVSDSFTLYTGLKIE